jgi:hypothetical protein
MVLSFDWPLEQVRRLKNGGLATRQRFEADSPWKEIKQMRCCVGFEVFTAVTVKNPAVFCDVACGTGLVVSLLAAV